MAAALQMTALFVFAHQDDELAIATRIERERNAICVFLTDGGNPTVRDAESRDVLTRLGVDDFHFLGADIPDGTLVEHLESAYAHLTAAMEQKRIDEVLTLAWEGGHQDHDAAHLVAVAFAQSRNVPCREFALYRGFIGPFFRVMSPLREGGMVRRLTWREIARTSMLWTRYRSQRRTWLALYPIAFAKLVLFRREVLRDVDPSRLLAPPHARPLFYERRFRFPWERFAAAAGPFVERRIDRQDCLSPTQ
jgi:LmbE family N-acetylglucosaminyl deacetylase